MDTHNMDTLVQNKEVAVPGEVLATGMGYLPSSGTFRDGDDIVASRVGLVNIEGRFIKLICLSGNYIPKPGDTIIGEVTNISFNSWSVDIGYAYEAALSLKEATSDYIDRGADLSQYFDFKDILVAKVLNVTKSKAIDLSMRGPGLRKLKGGRLIKVIPNKVPRIIGKQGSMINLVKEKTGCRIIVGQNGVVWIQGDDLEKESLATEAIQKIDAEAHKEGLTDEIKVFLEGKK